MRIHVEDNGDMVRVNLGLGSELGLGLGLGYLLINLKDKIFEPAVGSLPNLARMCP